MCQWGTDSEVRLARPREHSGRSVVLIDSCIAEEVQRLNDAGVITLGSCCGHGAAEPQALIDAESVALARGLGYTPIPYDDHSYQIRLAGNS